MDLQKSNEIFIPLVKLQIIVVFLKPKDQFQQVFILLLQGFCLPFYFYRLYELSVRFLFWDEFFHP